jgi:MFS family permease
MKWLKKNLPVWVATLGGFQFGFNTAVISGALLFLSRDFGMTPTYEGFAVSVILLGALLGSSTGGMCANRFGRKRAMGISALLFFVGVLAIYFSPFAHFFLLGRALQGVAVGIASVVSPMYLSEIAPAAKRGLYVSSNQFAITVGILATYGCNSYFAASGNWRMMFGIAAIPALLQLLGVFFIPESPVWEPPILRHKAKPQSRSYAALFKPLYRRVLLIGIVLTILQQVTGINAVIYFAPSIFQQAGFASAETAIFATVGIGVINVLSTLSSLWLLDRLGRRPLLLGGLCGMILSLLAIALAFFVEVPFIHWVALIGLMAYVASFAVGMGPVPWLILSEIYPLTIRGQAMGFASFMNWLANYIVAFTFLDLTKYVSTGGTFCIYAAFGVFAFFFVLRRLPETKGKTLGEIERLLKP